MIKSFKVRLLPTKEQEELMWKTINCSRFAYNWALNRWQELYKNEAKCSMGGIRKEFTQLKKKEEYKWLNEVSSTAMIEAMRNLDKAFKSFFKKKSGYPKFKSKKKSKLNFYVRYDRMYLTSDTCNIEKIGKVKYKTNYNIPTGKDVSYMNPYCSFDGKYWYLSFSVEVNENQVNLNKNLSIGIDLGIKDLAICSNGMVFRSINKTKTVKKLEKKLKRLQRQVSRKYKLNKDGNKYIKTNNIIKLEKQIKLIYRKLSNIRLNHIHQATSVIIKQCPYRIVMEDLNVSGMMKNRHLAKAVQEQCFYEFRRQIEYKSKLNGIEFVLADRFYPSSKTCCCCGHIKKDLKLKDRIYICDDCGLTIDRDYNASLNLMNYGLV